MVRARAIHFTFFKWQPQVFGHIQINYFFKIFFIKSFTFNYRIDKIKKIRNFNLGIQFLIKFKLHSTYTRKNTSDMVR